MKRLFWFVVGIGAGIFGVRYVKNKAKNAATQLTPTQVATDIYDGVMWLVNQLVELVQNLRSDTAATRGSHEKDVYVSQE